MVTACIHQNWKQSKPEPNNSRKWTLTYLYSSIHCVTVMRDAVKALPRDMGESSICAKEEKKNFKLKDSVMLLVLKCLCVNEEIQDGLDHYISCFFG